MPEIKCTCSKGVHRAPLDVVEISAGAINKLPQILKGFNKIFMVADDNTYRVCGEKAEEILRSAGIFSHKYVLKPPVLPNPDAIGNALINAQDPDEPVDIMGYSPLPDLILAVGSGTVNDVCRVVSFRLGIPYAVAATAPSMDGYASAGSAIAFDGTKKTVRGRTPIAIIADLDIVSEAPYDMLKAGIGDMLGKYTGILDWELARDFTGEYFCDKIAADVIKATDKCCFNGRKMARRDHETIKNIIEGLIVTGIGMAYTGVSRPASGAEHMIAHIWEKEDIDKGKQPNLHGIEVTQGTVICMAMYRKLYSETDDIHVKELTRKYIPMFDAAEDIIRFLDIPFTVLDRKKIIESVAAARFFRKRYTILEYLGNLGLLDKYAEYAADYIINFRK